MARGGYLHNQVLIDPIERRARELGMATAREVFVKLASGPVPAQSRHVAGYADLVIDAPGCRLAVEAELTTRRIEIDLLKAAALEATELWIVVPSPGVRRTVRSRLRALHVRSGSGVFVLLLSQALQRLARRAELFFPSNAPPENKSPDAEPIAPRGEDHP